MRALFTRLGRFVEARPGTILAGTLILVVLAVLGASQTRIVTTQEVFVDTGSDTYKDNQAYAAKFGGESLIVMIPGTPQELTSVETLGKVQKLTDQLSKDADVRTVVSPMTILSAASGSLPKGVTLATPGVATSIIFGKDGKPTSNFTSLFPTGQELVQITLKSGLSVDEQGAFSNRVQDAVKNLGLPSDTAVAGYPRVAYEMTSSIMHDLAVTGLVAVILMVIVLFLVFPVRRRLMALPVVLVGVLLTFGITGAGGVNLTLVTMAGLPVLLGLGMDFAIQFHNRYEEELARGDTPAAGLIDALTHIGPAVGTAVLATILGFLTLYLAAVPAVRDFGGLLALGVAILFVVALIVLNALLYRFDKEPAGLALPSETAEAEVEAESPATAVTRPAHKRPRLDIGRYLATVSDHAIKFGPIVLIVASLLALGGLYTDHLVPIQTDVKKLVPADSAGVVAMTKVADATGSHATVSFLVRADDVTSTNIFSWMVQFEDKELAAHPQIASITSLPSVLGVKTADLAKATPTSLAQIKAAAAKIPAPILAGLLSSDKKAAAMQFNVKEMPIADLENLIKSIQAEANPPSGVTIAPAGTANEAASVVSSITDRRLGIAIAGFLAVFFGLLLVYRNWRKAITPVIPIILVTGWSSGVMWALGLELNPLTAVMSALIVGIGTEFAVLLLERFWEELGRGRDPRAAMHVAVSRIGRAIAASGLTVMAGFAAIMASSFPAMREFGEVTVIDVLLALVATIVVVPPLALYLVRRRPAAREVTPAAQA